ncbi:MAG: hypothetical protein Q9217_003336 [Psora testacea]
MPKLRTAAILEPHRYILVDSVFEGSALEAAIRFGSQEVVKLLLEHRADVNARCSAWQNPLQAAVLFADSSTIKLLLEYGADINAQTAFGDTALRIAALDGKLEAVNLLLEHGAYVNGLTGYLGNALQAAAQSGRLQVIKLLLKHGADITVQPLIASRLSVLHLAVESESFVVLSMICERGGDIHLSTQDKRGLTPLHTAVIKGNVDIVRYLLGRGASPDESDFRNVYPLQSAIKKRNGEMSLLIYSYTKVDLPPIAASHWRGCSDGKHHRDLEIVGGPERSISFRDHSLRQDLIGMSYPISEMENDVSSHSCDFMHLHRHAKRAL